MGKNKYIEEDGDRMLKKLELDRKEKYQNFKISELGKRLARLQRVCQSMDIPILFIVDGWESSGRGKVIYDLVRELNPKYFDVDVFDRIPDEELEYLFLQRFWIHIPKKGHMKVYNRSFYYEVFDDLNISDRKLKKKIDSIRSIEKILYDDKTVIVKIFLQLSEEEQKKRIEEYENSKTKSFYVDILDKRENNNYEEYEKHYKNILAMTNFENSPWHIIDADNIKSASKEVLGIALEELEKGIERVSIQREKGIRLKRNYRPERKPLEEVDLTKSLDDQEYSKILKDLQKEVADMVLTYHKKKIPTVLVFEGVDAAGKDGAIKRLIRYVDPRIYKVHAISAPDQAEAARNYLWRFYKKLPKDGNMSIFSRSWYGRVMVERVEGFASDNEWERAYGEILEMEKQIHDHGGLILKFFLVIDKETQLERFQAREDDPDKQYKITSEDWRNREKWDEYIQAMNEMLDRTNVDYAPWIIVEGNSKKYARIKVIKEYLKLAKKHLEKIESQ